MIMIDDNVNKKGEIILCKDIKMDKNNENVLSYGEADLVSLCDSHKIYRGSNYSFMGDNDTINVEVPYKDAMYCNYVAFKNPKYGNKWIFGFVTDVKLISPRVSEITWEKDVWSTWFETFYYGKAFVEREHVSDDTVGLHTIPEGLETGDYVIQGSSALSMFSDDINDYYTVLGVTRYPGTTATPGDNTGGKIYSGVFSGLAYIVGENFAGTTNIIKSYEDSDSIDSIVCMFVAPKTLCQDITWTTVAGWSYNVKYGKIGEQEDEWGATLLSITKPSSLAGNYTPVNKKLLTWPYRYVNVDNNVGNCLDLKYEDFSDNQIKFDIIATLTPGTSYKIAPHNYKGVTTNYLYSFTPTKLPICNWQSDVYTNWITQNSVNVGLNVAGSGVSLAAGALTGNPIAIASGILGIANSLGQIYEHSFTPPSLKGNLNSGDVNFAGKVINPILYEMSIKREYAVALDGYFSRFGYKVNEVKTPNIKTRTQFNFVKIGGSDDLVTGNIPASDLEKINSIFRKGVTIFHNYTNFGNYTISNPIRS